MATIPVGDYPRALCFNSQCNTVYCANANSDNVTVIDGATDSVLATVAVGDYPCALYYNSHDNKVYCANYKGDDVTIVNGINNRVLTSIGVGEGPLALVWNSEQDRMSVANYRGGTVSVIRDSAPAGLAAGPKVAGRAMNSLPTVVSDVLLMPQGGQQSAISELLDAGGRRVASLHPGPNDARSLAPGVYFVRQTEKVSKVVLIR